jgi:putative spermidine/putrescine transport system permease protein
MGSERTDVILYLVCGLILIYLIVPIFIVIPISFSDASYLKFPPEAFSLRWFNNFFQSSSWVSSTWLSLKVAFATTILSTLIAIPTCFGLVRHNFHGRSILFGLILSPLVVPIIISAIAVYFLFAELKLIGSITGLVLAHTLLAFPKVVVVVTASLKGFDINLEHAASNLGAGRLQTFWLVTLPLIRPAVLSGAFFAFITSFDELIITMFICGTSLTLPKRMWDSLRFEIDPTIAAVSTILIFISVTLLVGVEILRRRGAALKGIA